MKDGESRRCRRSRTWIRSQWREHIVAHASSGLTAVDYCEAQGLHPKSFYRWKRVLRESGELEELLRGNPQQSASTRGKSGSLFSEVRVGDGAPPGTSGVEVALRSGIAIRVSRGFDGETLRQVVWALEEGAC